MIRSVLNQVKCSNLVGYYSLTKHNCFVRVAQNFSYSTLNFDINTSLNYTIEETAKILNAVNTTNIEGFASYNISKSRANKILTWKSKHGSFSNIDQILELDGFGLKVLEKFCASILKSTTEKLAVKLETAKRIPQLIIPLLTEKSRVTMKSCVSLHTSVNSITWTRFQITLGQPTEITHWNLFDIPDKKLHLTDLIQMISYINNMIPDADYYVFEAPQTAQLSTTGSPAQININVQKSQFVGMLAVLLSNRTLHRDFYQNLSNKDMDETQLFQETKQQQCVLFLKKFLTSRLFNTLIGTERVANSTIVSNLLRVHFNMEDKPDNAVDEKSVSLHFNVNNDLREAYNRTEGYQKEYMGHSLLMGMAFLRLCVFRCSDSIAVIVKNMQK